MVLPPIRTRPLLVVHLLFHASLNFPSFYHLVVIHPKGKTQVCKEPRVCEGLLFSACSVVGIAA